MVYGLLYRLNTRFLMSVTIAFTLNSYSVEHGTHCFQYVHSKHFMLKTNIVFLLILTLEESHMLLITYLVINYSYYQFSFKVWCI